MKVQLRQRRVFWFKTTLNLVPGVTLMVGFHPRPHVEEIFALWLIIRFAPREFLTQHCHFENGTWFVHLGINLGKFDEHGGWIMEKGQPVYIARKPGHCCATLVAEALESDGFRLIDYPGIQAMLSFVHDDDMGEDLPDDFHHNLPHALKYRYDVPITFRDSKDYIRIDALEHYCRVVNWVLQGLDARYNDLNWKPKIFNLDHLSSMMDALLVRPNRRQHWRYSPLSWFRFGQEGVVKAQVDYRTAYRAFPQEALVNVTTDFDGQELHIARWKTQNHHAGAAARSHGVHVLFQEQPDDSPSAGGVMVSCDHDRGFDLRTCAYQFNLMEQELESGTPQYTDPKELTRDGEGYPNSKWYFFHGRNRPGKPPGLILGNRYLSAPDTPTTLCDPDALWETLNWSARNPKYFGEVAVTALAS